MSEDRGGAPGPGSSGRQVPPVAGQPANQASPPPLPVGRRGGGIFLGVMLIALGAVFLVSQFVPALRVPWWTLWPLIFVIGGIVQVFTPGSNGWGVDRVFEGLGTIIFGLILLGNTTGYISWSVWWTVVTLWPALVIALGLTILGKGLGQGWLRIVATLVIWATLAYAVVLSLTGGVAGWPVGLPVSQGGQASFAEPGLGVKKASLLLKGGAGEIKIGSGSKLVAVDTESVYGTPVFATGRDGDSAWVRIGFNESGRSTVVVPGMTGARIDTKLSDTALWDIALETGASSVDANLEDLRVRNLEVKTGASAVVLRLGEVPSGQRSSTVLVKAGVSSVRILLPRGAEARVSAQNGLVANDVRGRFQRRDDTWQTPGYSSASKTWDIRTEAGVGSVSIDTY